jgi:hypothetical protein
MAPAPSTRRSRTAYKGLKGWWEKSESLFFLRPSTPPTAYHHTLIGLDEERITPTIGDEFLLAVA